MACLLFLCQVERFFNARRSVANYQAKDVGNRLLFLGVRRRSERVDILRIEPLLGDQIKGGRNEEDCCNIFVN